MPVQESNRQELMNAGPHHAKLRVTAHVAAPVCVAGTDVTGKIDVECRAEKGLGLGAIMVELMAIQELNSRDHAATSTFIHTRRLFQGPGLPPSNAVISGDENGAFPPHHYPARRGVTTFFFRFPLPLTSPASVEFGSGIARIRYEVRASASVAWKGERRLVTNRQDVQVVESATQEVESAGTVVGESGKIWVQAKVLGGAVIAGQTCCIELHVKNHSSRKSTGVNVSLRRVLHLDNPPPEHANLIISDTLVTAPFNSAEYCCPPGVEGVAKLVINVPRTARTVKGGSRESGEAGSDKSIPALFDVRGSINVRLCMGVGAKDLSLDLPVVISHPAATPAEPPFLGPPNQDVIHGRPTSPYASYEPPRSPFAPPHSPVQPYQPGYAPYPPSSPVPYTQVYFPPMSPQPPNILNYFPAPPMSPTLPMSPGPPTSPAPLFSSAPPFTPIIPPTSTYQNPVYAHPLYHYPPGPPRSPVPPHTLHVPQYAHAQSMPQLGPPQSPPRFDGLPSRGPLPPLPPRPTSAEPYVHQVAVDLPPTAGPSSPAAARVFPALETNTENANGVEGKGARASRISEHLRMSSRTRSVSPTGRRFPGARPRPPPSQSPVESVGVGVEVLSPGPLPAPLPGGTNQNGSGIGSTGQIQVKDLEEMISAHKTEIPNAHTSKAQRSERTAARQIATSSAPASQDTVNQDATVKSLPPPPPLPARKNPTKAPSEVHSPITALANGDSQTARSAPAVSTPKPTVNPIPVLKPLKPVPTGLTALERRLTAKVELPRLAPNQPTRRPVQKPEPPSPAGKLDSGKTIDWGEIARIGKLKSFALERKKPAVTSFFPPILPSNLFDNPKPKPSPVPRKPVPSLDARKPIVERKPSPVSCPLSPPQTDHVLAPISASTPDVGHLVRYQLSDSPMSKVSNSEASTNQLTRHVTQTSQVPAQPPAISSQRPLESPQLASQPPQLPRPISSSRPPASPRTSSSPQPPSSPQKSNSQRPVSVQLSNPQQFASSSSTNQMKEIPTIVKQSIRSSTIPAAVAPTAPKNAIRYQLSDPPVPKPQSTSNPVQVNHVAPASNVPNYRAVLKPVSAPRPASPSKPTPRPVEQKGLNIQASTAPVAPQSNPVSRTSTPRVLSFPPPEPELRGSQKDVRVISQPSTHPSQRSLSPQRPRPLPPNQPQPTVTREHKSVADDRLQPLEPRRVSAESQAVQKAKYFESLAAGRGLGSPTKPKLAQVVTRQILRPQEANMSHERPEPARVAHSQPPAAARVIPRSPSPPSITAGPTLPREDTGPRFTAMPVAPTAPTARSLIPVTSSGFEVPAILPGNDARERADAALREAELFRLKREAIGRVPMWISSDAAPQAPPPTRAVRQSGHELAAYSNWDLQHPTKGEPTMAELLAVMDKTVAHVAYDPQLKHPRPRPMASKSAAALMPGDAELLSKYDVRSARGGKGGQVAAVASIWQNAAVGPPPKQHGPLSATKTVSQDDRTTFASPIMASSPGIVKSASVPTMMYPATAVPVLSSTASLARPLGEPEARVRQLIFPPTIPESQSDDVLVRRTSQPTQGIAVGQARLKELIGKYQS